MFCRNADQCCDPLHIRRTGRLPEDEAALWDWLLAQDSAIVSSLIAYCIASAMKPVMDSVRLP